ncbi:MAG: 2-oxoacid:acceptor oxidoreductase family protein, partial [bacterium]
YKVDVTKLTRDAIADINLGTKEKDRCKNMFVLGFLYWMFDRDMQTSINFLNEKFSKKAEILEANLRVLKAGYAYGETTETFSTRFKVEKAKMPAGKYRNIMGNQALALGIVAASYQSGLPVF